MTRNWNTIRAKLANLFDPDWERIEQQVQAMIAKQDAKEQTRPSKPAPVTSSAAAFASIPMLRSGNEKSTPYNLREYTDPSKMVRGQFGRLHTFIRPEKWKELQDLKKMDPRRYVKRTKQMRKRDNRDPRLAAQAAAEVPKDPDPEELEPDELEPDELEPDELEPDELEPEEPAGKKQRMM